MTAGARRMEALELDALPRGRLSPCWVDVVQDGFGAPVAVPVLVARGERPGPVFGLSAALHGNELNGIPVVHRLMDEIDVSKLRGTVVAVVVANPVGYHRHQRRFGDDKDLNRLFPGTPHGTPSQVFVRRLLDRVIARFDFLVDLHTASFGRVNSLYVRADMRDGPTAVLARLARPQIILHKPPSDRTLRGAAAELRIPSITIEIGNPQVIQAAYIRPTLVGVRSMLAEAKMLPRRNVAPGKPPVLCDRSRWIRTTHGGLLEVFPAVTDLVEEGEFIARQTDIFGALCKEHRAPEAGIVIGKSTNPVGSSGSRLIHLGRVVDELGPDDAAPLTPPDAALVDDDEEEPT